jgi:hypothetical protein
VGGFQRGNFLLQRDKVIGFADPLGRALRAQSLDPLLKLRLLGPKRLPLRFKRLLLPQISKGGHHELAYLLGITPLLIPKGSLGLTHPSPQMIQQFVTAF